MFSSAVRVGTRLNAWKTKPIRSRRSVVRPLWPRVDTLVPPTMMLPDVRRSKPTRQCIRVDLPDPDGRMMAVNWPRTNPTVTPSRACTTMSPCR